MPVTSDGSGARRLGRVLWGAEVAGSVVPEVAGSSLRVSRSGGAGCEGTGRRGHAGALGAVRDGRQQLRQLSGP